MAKRTKIEKPELIVSSDESFYEVVIEIVDYEELKKVVCPFYKKGRAAKCAGCMQEEDTVQDCKLSYLDGINKRPEFGGIDKVYTPAFDLPVVKKRESKITIVEAHSIGLVCNTCHISDNCPSFVEDYECGIDWGENVDTKNPKAVIQYLIDIQTVRVTRARKMEEIDGGMPDQTTSTEMDRLTNLVATKDNLDADRFSLRVDATAKSGSEGGGLLAKLFGGNKDEKEALPEPVIQTIDFEDLETKPATADKRSKNGEKAKG